jgi:hypothetical protein
VPSWFIQKESVRILRGSEDLAGLAEALARSATVQNVGYSDPIRALELAEEAAQVARRAGDDCTLGALLKDVGLAWAALGNPGKPGTLWSRQLPASVVRVTVGNWRRCSRAWPRRSLLMGAGAGSQPVGGESEDLVGAWPAGNIAYCREGFARLAVITDGCSSPASGVWRCRRQARRRLGAGTVEEASVESWLRVARSALDAEAAEAGAREL